MTTQNAPVKFSVSDLALAFDLSSPAATAASFQELHLQLTNEADALLTADLDAWMADFKQRSTAHLGAKKGFTADDLEIDGFFINRRPKAKRASLHLLAPQIEYDFMVYWRTTTLDLANGGVKEQGFLTYGLLPADLKTQGFKEMLSKMNDHIARTLR